MRLNLKRLGLLAGKGARMFAARAQLTPQRVDLLLLLRRETLKQSDIANYLCVTRSVVSRMVKALEEQGLVVRSRGSDDRRERHTSITTDGRARLALCFPKPTWHGAQDEGERQWLRWWRKPIATLGIRVDNILRSRQPTFFAGFAAKQECYPEIFAPVYTLPLWLYDPKTDPQLQSAASPELASDGESSTVASSTPASSGLLEPASVQRSLRSEAASAFTHMGES